MEQIHSGKTKSCSASQELRQWIFRFYKILEISSLDEQLLASRERFSTMNFFIYSNTVIGTRATEKITHTG
jgi:hypothetical protein